jgi:hypothetical protein
MSNSNGKTQRSRRNGSPAVVESTALALPQITRAPANQILKARAVELYQDARSAQQHEHGALSVAKVTTNRCSRSTTSSTIRNAPRPRRMPMQIPTSPFACTRLSSPTKTSQRAAHALTAERTST